MTALVGLAVPAAPATAHGQVSLQALTDRTAATTRTVPAYLPSSHPDRVISVFNVRFRAERGERRLVRALIEADQSTRTPDELLMASASLTCAPTASGVTSAAATTNVMRGRTARLTPRFVYVAPRTGTVSCWVVASGLRPRPAAGTSRNTWQVSTNSWLAVSSRLPRWNRSVTTSRSSTVLDRGESWTQRQTVWVPKHARSFAVRSDHKVTTCSAVGGSRDSSTGGRELCDGRVDRAGSVVGTRVQATQRAVGGGSCGSPKVVVDRRFRVLADVHHLPLFTKGARSVSRARACRPSFVVTSRITNRSGADVVVHAPSYRVAITKR